jgi:hypothetical protein
MDSVSAGGEKIFSSAPWSKPVNKKIFSRARSFAGRGGVIMIADLVFEDHPPP